MVYNSFNKGYLFLVNLNLCCVFQNQRMILMSKKIDLNF